MNRNLRILLSIPSVLILIMVPYNFFVNIDGERLILFYRVLNGLNMLYLISLIYIIFHLWRDNLKSRSIKWTWTLLMIFCAPPIATIVYIWAVEPERKK